MSVARSYAQALLSVAEQSQLSSEQIEQIESQIDTVCGLLNRSRDLKVALQSPLTTVKEKLALIEQLVQSFGLTPLLSQFLQLLARKNRLTLLDQIRDAFSSVRLMNQGGVLGRLVVAESLSEAEIEDLARLFSKKLGKKVAFRVSSDPSLLAGIKVTVGGVTYDGTLRSQLQKLRDQFVSGIIGAQV